MFGFFFVTIIATVCGGALGASPDAVAMCAIADANPLWPDCPVCGDPCNKTACPAVLCSSTGHIVELDLANVTLLPLALGSLSHLTSLTVQHCSFTSMPKDVLLSLSHLRKLCVTKNANLQEIPDEIGSLSSLKSLSLSYNELSALPDSIGSLAMLTQLTIENNELHTLPSTFTHLTNLTYLDVSFNKLRTLVRYLDGLDKLEFLYANDNFIAVLAEDMLPGYEITACDFANNCIVDDLSLVYLENSTCTYTTRPDCNATSDAIPDLFSSDDPPVILSSSSSENTDGFIDAASKAMSRITVATLLLIIAATLA